MEEKINIAELLKDCPKGMELDCTMFDDVSFAGLQDSSFPIIIHTPDGCKFLTPFGCYHDSCRAKCVIFPKGKNTWEKFVSPCKFKDGDILATDLSSVFILNTHRNTNECYGCYAGVCCDGVFYINEPFAYKECCNLATKEEREKLFQTIKDKGYKWNAETKTLEKLIEPKFKVGDRIRHKIVKNTHVITGIKDEYYIMDEVSFPHGILPIEAQKEYELVPHKFDINTLKPFDKVLVRDNDKMEWDISFFSHCNGLEFYKYSCLNGSGYAQCIPYEENKHLLGKTNKCDEFYIFWEE